MDCFSELDTDIAVLTETWLRDKEIGQLQEKLSLGSGLGLIARNRRPKENGVSYGGVAVVWKESVGSFKEVKLKNKEGFKFSKREETWP